MFKKQKDEEDKPAFVSWEHINWPTRTLERFFSLVCVLEFQAYGHGNFYQYSEAIDGRRVHSEKKRKGPAAVKQRGKSSGLTHARQTVCRLSARAWMERQAKSRGRTSGESAIAQMPHKRPFETAATLIALCEGQSKWGGGGVTRAVTLDTHNAQVAVVRWRRRRTRRRRWEGQRSGDAFWICGRMGKSHTHAVRHWERQGVNKLQVSHWVSIKFLFFCLYGKLFVIRWFCRNEITAVATSNADWTFLISFSFMVL